MKLEKVVGLFENAPLICPKCKRSLTIENGSFICCENHCYDLSTKGYINLAKVSGDPKYDKTLFTARKHVLEAGYYSQLAQGIKALIPSNCRVLDAGCGEGFYACCLWENREVYGIDLAKAGIECADKSKGVKWVVGDLAALPFKDNSFDAVINILSPSNYSEFNRVLKTGGMLIKAVPGEEYLKELRHVLGKDVHSAKATVDTFSSRVIDFHQQRLNYKVTIRSEHQADFFRMTPLTFHKDIGIMPSSITIDIHLLWGRI